MQNNPKLILHLSELVSMPHANKFEAAQAYHAMLKTSLLWETLVLVGPQEIDEDSHLELKNCPCGSTIAKLCSGPATK